MSATEAFVATVGTQLIEYTSSLPWRAPLPPALAGARGWYMPTSGGPRCLFTIDAAGRSLEELAGVIAEWDLWMGAIHADEAVLLLVWESGRPTEAVAPLLPDESPWPVWALDLAEHAIYRRHTPTVEQAFSQIAESLIVSYFEGIRMTPGDLSEQELARSEGRPPFRVFLGRARSPATWVLLGAIGALFIATELAGGSTTMAVMWRAGINFRPLVEAGEWWRLITANFLHFGWMHLAVNAYSLFAVGPMLEKLYGTGKFLTIYVLAGVTGALASLMLNGGSSAGASGALFGLLGAMLVIGLRHHGVIPAHFRKDMRNIALVTLAINLAIGFTIPAIDNWAHLGGLLGGLLVALALGPSPQLVGRRPNAGARFALAMAPAVAAIALGIGVANWTSGREPVAFVEGPKRDFGLKVPLDTLYGTTEQDLYLSADGNAHWISISSHENRDANPSSGAPGLTEASLEAYAPGIAEALAAGEKRSDKATVIQSGKHRFLRVALQTTDGREEAYMTATSRRIYVIRTKGLETEAWMRPALEQALASFEPKTP